MSTTKICLIIILRVTIKLQTIYIDLCLQDEEKKENDDDYDYYYFITIIIIMH